MANRALRPLSFEPATSTDILSQGHEWIQKMKRLKHLGYRPDRCLITAREPMDEDGLRCGVFRQIGAEPLTDDFVVVGKYDTAKVVDFARLPESAVLKLA